MVLTIILIIRFKIKTRKLIVTNCVERNSQYIHFISIPLILIKAKETKRPELNPKVFGSGPERAERDKYWRIAPHPPTIFVFGWLVCACG